MQFKRLVTKSFKINLAAITIATLLFCTFTYAENQSQPSTRPLEAWEQAQDYSLAHPVVAFAVYGRTEKFTALENAERIRTFLARQNIESTFFLALENEMKSAVEFFIQGVSYGPVGLAKALPIIQTVATHYKEEYETIP